MNNSDFILEQLKLNYYETRLVEINSNLTTLYKEITYPVSNLEYQRLMNLITFYEAEKEGLINQVKDLQVPHL